MMTRYEEDYILDLTTDGDEREQMEAWAADVEWYHTPQYWFHYLLTDGVSLTFAIVVADEKPAGAIRQQSKHVWLVRRVDFERGG